MTPTPALDASSTLSFVQKVWDGTITPTLVDYVKIPAKSPAFDAKWRENGHIARAVDLVRRWCEKRPIEGLSVDVVQLENRTPVILMDIPGGRDELVPGQPGRRLGCLSLLLGGHGAGPYPTQSCVGCSACPTCAGG